MAGVGPAFLCGVEIYLTSRMRTGRVKWGDQAIFVFVDSHFFAPVIDYLAIFRVSSPSESIAFVRKRSVMKW